MDLPIGYYGIKINDIYVAGYYDGVVFNFKSEGGDFQYSLEAFGDEPIFDISSYMSNMDSGNDSESKMKTANIFIPESNDVLKVKFDVAEVLSEFTILSNGIHKPYLRKVFGVIPKQYLFTVSDAK